MANLITEHVPATGDELEIIVREILAECGLAADRGVHLALPRGGVNIDVKATETVNGIQTHILCECKNWATSVPQAIVHGFRTVMQEAGAHRGYIISRIGFQRGAVEAAYATNIELVTFEEFQKIYFEKWLSARCWAIEKEIRGFPTYYEPLGIPGMHLLTDEAEQEKYCEVWCRYRFAGTLLLFFSPYIRMVGSPKPLPPLPLDVTSLEQDGVSVPRDIKQARGYRELAQLLLEPV